MKYTFSTQKVMDSLCEKMLMRGGVVTMTDVGIMELIQDVVDGKFNDL